MNYYFMKSKVAVSPIFLSFSTPLYVMQARIDCARYASLVASYSLGELPPRPTGENSSRQAYL